MKASHVHPLFFILVLPSLLATTTTTITTVQQMAFVDTLRTSPVVLFTTERPRCSLLLLLPSTQQSTASVTPVYYSTLSVSDVPLDFPTLFSQSVASYSHTAERVNLEFNRIHPRRFCLLTNILRPFFQILVCVCVYVLIDRFAVFFFTPQSTGLFVRVSVLQSADFLVSMTYAFKRFDTIFF